MKKALSLLSAVLLVGGLSSAQEVMNTPAADTPIMATFYDGEPFGNGDAIEDDFGDVVEAKFTDSPIGEHIDGLEGEDYVVLSVGDLSFTFDTMGGDRPSTIQPVYDGDSLDGDLSLADVVSFITTTLAGKDGLVVFTDEDGVVTGFYRYIPGEDYPPAIDISSETEAVTVIRDGEVMTFETSSGGARPLEYVNVTDSAGELVLLNGFLN